MLQDTLGAWSASWSLPMVQRYFKYNATIKCSILTVWKLQVVPPVLYIRQIAMHGIPNTNFWKFILSSSEEEEESHFVGQVYNTTIWWMENCHGTM
jgi:hypothetical protein